MEVFDEEWKPASKPPHPPFLMVYGMVAPLRMYCVAFFYHASSNSKFNKRRKNGGK